MNFFTFSSIIMLVTGATSLLILLPRRNFNPTYKPLILFNLSATFWGIGCIIIGISKDIHISLIGWQIATMCSVTVPVTHHHFVLSFIGLKKPIQLTLFYLFSFYFLILNVFFPQFFVDHLSLMFNEMYYYDWLVNKNFNYPFMYISLYLILLPYSFSLLIKTHYQRNIINKKLPYYIFGSAIGWLGAHNDFAPVFGLKAYPYLNLAIPFGLIAINYAAFKYKFLDFRLMLRKSLIYTILTSIVYISFLLIIFLVEFTFSNTFQYNSIYISILLITFFAVILTPIRKKFSDYIEKTLFKAITPEIAEQNELLRREVADKEKFKAVSTLASGLAHEIKNPLTTIKVFSEHIVEKRDDPQFLEKYSTLVSSEIDRIDNLVHQLIDFAKPAPLKKKDCAINPLIEDVVELLNSKFLKHNITVHTDYQNPNLIIHIDPNQIKQVILNLLLNAVEAMTNGGEISIKTECLDGQKVKKLKGKKDIRSNEKAVASGKLQVSENQPLATNHYPLTTITITDSGPGIDPKDLKHIFDPFYSKKDEGTGLGLAICHSIIEQHGGTIRVESELGVGSKFVISI